MKCDVVRELIFKYRELEDAERSAVDFHVKNCEACRQIFSGMEELSTVVARASAFHPEIPHAAKLTGRVMEAIVSRQPTDRRRASWLDHHVFRYGMMFFSIGLVVVFAAQVSAPTLENSPGMVSKPAVPKSNVSSVQLNTPAMLSQVHQEISDRAEAKSLYLCARLDQCGNWMIQRIKTNRRQ